MVIMLEPLRLRPIPEDAQEAAETSLRRRQPYIAVNIFHGADAHAAGAIFLYNRGHQKEAKALLEQSPPDRALEAAGAALHIKSPSLAVQLLHQAGEHFTGFDLLERMGASQQAFHLLGMAPDRVKAGRIALRRGANDLALHLFEDSNPSLGARLFVREGYFQHAAHLFVAAGRPREGGDSLVRRGILGNDMNAFRASVFVYDRGLIPFEGGKELLRAKQPRLAMYLFAKAERNKEGALLLNAQAEELGEDPYADEYRKCAKQLLFRDAKRVLLKEGRAAEAARLFHESVKHEEGFRFLLKAGAVLQAYSLLRQAPEKFDAALAALKEGKPHLAAELFEAAGEHSRGAGLLRKAGFERVAGKLLSKS